MGGKCSPKDLTAASVDSKNSRCQGSHSLPKRIKIWVARFCLGRSKYNRDMRNRQARMSPKGRWAGKKLLTALLEAKKGKK